MRKSAPHLVTVMTSPRVQGLALKQRVVGHPDLQTAFGSSTLSALQNTYSLSISYAQARIRTPLLPRLIAFLHGQAVCDVKSDSATISHDMLSYRALGSLTGRSASRGCYSPAAVRHPADVSACIYTSATYPMTLLSHADSGRKASGSGHHGLVPSQHRLQRGGGPALHHHPGLHGGARPGLSSFAMVKCYIECGGKARLELMWL